MDVFEAELSEPINDYRVSRANRVAIARDSCKRCEVKVIGMAVGNDQKVNSRKLLKVNNPLRTRNHRTILERIEKDRVHQTDGPVHFDQNRRVAQQGYFHNDPHPVS